MKTEITKLTFRALALRHGEYTPVSKIVVGENDECQLSNGGCTTEKKFEY